MTRGLPTPLILAAAAGAGVVAAAWSAGRLAEHVDDALALVELGDDELSRELAAEPGPIPDERAIAYDEVSLDQLRQALRATSRRLGELDDLRADVHELRADVHELRADRDALDGANATAREILCERATADGWERLRHALGVDVADTAEHRGEDGQAA